MHDLRREVYRHLQRLPLAFFTRTRTGEVQSRIANDIGGVQSVVTTTATSIVQNVTTVLATVTAMALLDWRLAVFSLAVLPLFVFLSRRVGAQRKRITAQRQETMADISTLVEESLSVSGILLGKTMGRSGELADRFDAESAQPGRPRGPRADGRPLGHGDDPDVVRRHAGARLPRRRAAHRGRQRHHHHRHRRRVHHAADAAALPRPVAAQRRRRRAELAGAVRADLRVPRPARGARATARTSCG